MAKSAAELNEALAEAVVDMDEDAVTELANEVVDQGYDALEAIDQGLAKGMDKAGKLFEEEEYFVPELLMCSDAVNTGIDILKPHIKMESAGEKHKIVVGVIEGDTHDIGKNLVKVMLSSANFDVVDAGRDVPPAKFVDLAVQEGAQIIMIAALMTTTMDKIGDTINLIKERGLEGKIKVVIGGAPISPAFAKKVGADAYSINANAAVRIARDMLGC